MSQLKKCEWQTHFTFSMIKGERRLYVQKEDLHTWYDLLFELQDHTNILWNYIEVAINMRKVYYDLDTKLVDIDIRKEDFCLILKKPSFESSKQKQEYQNLVKKQTQICMREINQKSEILEVKRLESEVKRNSNYEVLLNSLTRKYSKLECLVAIGEYKDDREKVVAYLQSKQAGKRAAGIMREYEREYLNEYLNSKSMLQVKKWMQENRIDERAYRGIIQKIYNENYKFRQFQPRHKKYVEIFFLGRPFPSQDESSDQDQNPVLLKQLKEMVDKAKNPSIRFIKKKEKDEMIRKLVQKGKVSESQAAEALFQSSNDQTKAYEIVTGGLVSQVENLNLFMKKNGRLNMILNFFTQPCFEKIRKQLYGKKQKTVLFVEWVSKSNRNIPLFVTLLDKYKDYIISMLSGVTELQKQQKMVGEIQLEAQSSPGQQSKLKKQIEEMVDWNLVKGLKKAGEDESLAVIAVKAAGNDLSKVQQYLILRGVNRQFDFCANDAKSQQLYLTKKFRNEDALLRRLKDQKAKKLWLLEKSELQPMLFEMIVRNKRYFDKLVGQRQ